MATLLEINNGACPNGVKKLSKRCVMCKTINPNPLIKTCSYDCANAYLKSDKGIAQKAKTKIRLEKKAESKKRREWADTKKQVKGLTHWENATQKVVNQFVLFRDKDLPCISCGIKNHEISSNGLTGSEWHAGHFISVKVSSFLRFHLWNINKQCCICNQHLSSNRSGYEAGIIARYGQPRLDWLIENKNRLVLNRDIAYLEKMRKSFRKHMRKLGWLK